MQVYERPATDFVAGFVGTANLTTGADSVAVHGVDATVSLRPERIQISSTVAADERGASGVVTDVAYVGSQIRLVVRLDSGIDMIVVTPNTAARQPAATGDQIRLAWKAEHALRVGATESVSTEGEEKMNRRKLAILVTCLGLALASAGCGSSGTSGTSGAPPKIAALDKLGKPEGSVNVIAWAGYAEDGSNDPKVDWVHPFTKATGCKVNVKVAGTSDEMVTLMKTNQYDVVSASGDASLRLVYSGTVAPVNTALVPNYATIFPFLKNRAWNSVGGTAYGVPHGWGANLLQYNTDVVKPAPTSWSSVFAANSPYKGKVTAYDSPIYIADAALYLMNTNKSLGIKNPYALDDKQFAAAVALLKQQKANVGEYWSDYTKSVQSFESGGSVLGTTWQVINNLITSDKKVKVNAILPAEGSTGWSDTWMVAAKAPHPTCAYKWLDWIVSPSVNAQVATYFGEAPAQSKACAEAGMAAECATFHAADKPYSDKIWYWTTPTVACLDGRTDTKCADYTKWTQAWTDIKG
ncbi:extracellular solute-binding protein [Fodinicola feengrottensis]